MKRFITLLFLALVVPAVVWSGEKVTVRGVSFFEEGREAIAREKALEEAKRAAIEQAVGDAKYGDQNTDGSRSAGTRCSAMRPATSSILKLSVRKKRIWGPMKLK